MRRSYFCAVAKVLCSDSTPYSRVNSKCGIAPLHLPLSVTPLPATLHRWDTTKSLPEGRRRFADQSTARLPASLPALLSAQLALHPKHRHGYAHAECRWQSAISAFAMRVVSHRHGLITLCARPSVQCLQTACRTDSSSVVRRFAWCPVNMWLHKRRYN